MKYLKPFMHICAILCICIITGFVSAYIIAKPINLTEEEISYYTNTAEKIWYEGFHSLEEDDSIYVTVNFADKKVQILPINNNKQSVTVDFTSLENIITVNNPVVNFWGCFFLYGAFFGFGIYWIICGGISIAKRRYKK